MMRRALLLAFALLLLAPSVGAVEQEHTVYLHEYSGGLHIVPEQIHANVGDVLKLTITNEGQSPHNFMLCGDGETPLEKCDDRWGFTGMIAANGSAAVTATVKTAGTFDYYCYIAGHKGAGMAGKLVVAGEEKNKTPSIGAPALLAILGTAALVGTRRLAK